MKSVSRTRTTLTLDADLLFKLKAEMRRTGLSFRELVNAVLRRGLNQQPEPARKSEPFVVKARSLGMRQGLNYDKISELIEYGEGPWHR